MSILAKVGKPHPPQAPHASLQKTYAGLSDGKRARLWRIAISHISSNISPVADVADGRGVFRERSRPWGAIQPRRLGTDAPARSDDTLREMPHEVRSASTGMVAHLGAIPGRGPSVLPLVPAACQGSAPTPRTPEERVP